MWTILGFLVSHPRTNGWMISGLAGIRPEKYTVLILNPKIVVTELGTSVFQKILSGIQSECQTVCKSYQQTKLVGKELWCLGTL